MLLSVYKMLQEMCYIYT